MLKQEPFKRVEWKCVKGAGVELNGPLINFGGFKAHISVNLMTRPSRNNSRIHSRRISAGRERQVPLRPTHPYLLIARIVKFRVKENLAEADSTNN